MTDEMKKETMAKDVNIKAQIMKDFLTQNKIEAFAVQEIGDNANTVVFASNIEVEGQEIPFIILLDDSVYALLQVQVVSKLLKDSKNDILPFLNDLNEGYRMLKYSVNAEGDLLLSLSMVTGNDSFSPELTLQVLDEMVVHLRSNYSQIMKKIWAQHD